MKSRYLYLCGMAAPLLFVFTSLLGGALRPGYSHIAHTVSELFSPGSPNKPLLDLLHTTYALLLILFGIGILRFVRRSARPHWTGLLGAALYIAMACVSVLTAAVFPQDPWGTPPTFAGEMHLRLTGIVGLLSLFAILLLGYWFHRANLFHTFWAFSLATIGAVILSTVFFLAAVDSPLMGLAERISGTIGFLWTFTLALWMYLNAENTAFNAAPA